MVELFTLKGVTIETRRPGEPMAVYKQEVQMLYTDKTQRLCVNTLYSMANTVVPRRAVFPLGHTKVSKREDMP